MLNGQFRRSGGKRTLSNVYATVQRDKVTATLELSPSLAPPLSP